VIKLLIILLYILLSCGNQKIYGIAVYHFVIPVLFYYYFVSGLVSGVTRKSYLFIGMFIIYLLVVYIGNNGWFGDLGHSKDLYLYLYVYMSLVVGMKHASYSFFRVAPYIIIVPYISYFIVVARSGNIIDPSTMTLLVMNLWYFVILKVEGWLSVKRFLYNVFAYSSCVGYLFLSYSDSRAAIVILILMLMSIMIVVYKEKRSAVLLICFAVVSFIVFLGLYTNFYHRVIDAYTQMSTMSGTAGDRYKLWSSIVTEIVENNFGIGVGGYKKFLGYSGMETAESFYFNIFSAGGFVSVVFVFYIFFRLFLHILFNKPIYLLFFFIFLLSIATNPYGFMPTGWFILGLILVFVENHNNSETVQTQRVRTSFNTTSGYINDYRVES